MDFIVKDIDWTFSQAAIVAFFSMLGELGLFSALLYYLKAGFHFDKDQFADLLIINRIAGIISQLILMPMLARVINEEKLLVIGLAFNCMHIFLYVVSVWFKDMYQMLMDGHDLPHLAFVVVVRRQMEKSSIARDFPVAKITYSLLKDGVSSSLFLSGWNKGRIICQQAQLKRILADMELASKKTRDHHFE